MKSTTKTILLAVCIGISISFQPVLAQTSSLCRVIDYQEGHVYEIKSAMYQGTYIRLPNKLAVSPIVASKLWTVEGVGNHIMIMPNSAEKEGKNTTLVLIDKHNNTYNIKLTRVSSESSSDSCVTIKEASSLFEKSGTPVNNLFLDEDEQKALKQKISSLEASLEEEKAASEAKIDEYLKKYRSFIYTRYKWNNGKRFKGKDLITDVYDDGRWTFIRVSPDNRGMLSISAEIDGKEEMIEYVAETETLYRISGIYPRFNLKYGKTELTVKRNDNSDNGVY